MLRFLKQLFFALEPYLIKYLKTVAVKAAVTLFFKKSIPGIFQLKIIKYAVKNILFDKAITPAVQKIFLELGYSFDVGDGQILIKRLKKASDENNQDDYDSTIDDILS